MAKKNNGPRILSIDLGYSAVKLCYRNREGLYQFEKYISCLARVPNVLQADDDTLFKLGLDYYILSEEALKTNREYLINLEDWQGLYESYPVWISYIIKKFKDRGYEFDKIAIGLSLAFSDKADELLAHLYESLMIDPNTKMFAVFPQGMSAAITYKTCGVNIREKNSDYKARNYLIVDGGFLTLDIANIVNSTASPASCLGKEGTGTIVIAQELQDYIYKTYELRKSIKECQKALEVGYLIHRGREIDLEEKINEYSKKYLANVLNFIEEKFSTAIDNLEAILVVGGVSYFFKKYLNDPDVIKEIEKHFPVSFLKIAEDGEYYNAFSYLLLTEKLLGIQN